MTKKLANVEELGFGKRDFGHKEHNTKRASS